MKSDDRPRGAKKQKLPRGWTEKKIQGLIDYYENQTEEEQVAEHQSAYHSAEQTMMGVPTDLVPEVRKLIARRDPRIPPSRSSATPRGKTPL